MQVGDDDDDNNELERLLRPSNQDEDDEKPAAATAPAPHPAVHVALAPDSFWLARVLVVRVLGVVLVCEFAVSAFQNAALFGERGIDPATIREGFPAPVFALVGLGDKQLELVAWTGVFLSLVFTTSLTDTPLLPLALWTLYLSLINLSPTFLANYGWEWQVLETTLLVCFLLPTLAPRRATEFPPTPPSRPVLWLLRWLAFRVMLGAGLSKLGTHASPCWRDLTCTATHYQTQPLPNPLAWFAHKLPLWFHRSEVVFNHVVELVACWGFLMPVRPLRLAAGLLSIFYMLALWSTGNYSVINWITIVPCIAVLDDRCLQPLFSSSTVWRAARAHAASLVAPPSPGQLTPRRVVEFLLVCFVAFKSVDPVKELMSDSPWLNHYDNFYFVNSYGVFGFVNKVRFVTVLEYSHGSAGEWKALDFPCLPGTLDRRPCVVAPYHYRLDWDTWIHTTASLESPTSGFPLWQFRGFVSPQMRALIAKLFAGDRQAAGLLGTPVREVFAGGQPPTAIRATLYHYRFSSLAQLAKEGKWWERAPVHGAEEYFTPSHFAHGPPQEPLWWPPASRAPLMGVCVLGAFASLCLLFAPVACGGGEGGATRKNKCEARPHHVVPRVPDPVLGLCFFAGVFALGWLGAFALAVGLCVGGVGVCALLSWVMWKERLLCWRCVGVHLLTVAALVLAVLAHREQLAAQGPAQLA